MFALDDAFYIGLCLEWFFYGKISILWALTCTVTLAKEVQLFLGLGIYSGILVIYLQCQKKDSRTATIVFYALCLLYVLSTATVVCDLALYVVSRIGPDALVVVSNNSVCNLKSIFLSVMLVEVNVCWHSDCRYHNSRYL